MAVPKKKKSKKIKELVYSHKFLRLLGVVNRSGIGNGVTPLRGLSGFKY
jgi:ribosomal protein L32